MSVKPSFKSLTAFLILLIISSIGGMVYGETSLPVLEKNVDLIWIVAAATMVFFMQIGFTAFETGCVQAKNAISVALKNVIVFLLCSVFFFFSGFALMFGDSVAGLVGASNFLFWGLEDIHLGYAFAFFQVVFAGTAATIITGAMCERTRIFTHIWSSILIICVVYPIFGHWAWGGNLHYGQAGWLQRMGFIDFAGSTVVHSIGGWFALAGALVVGPRIGRYNPDGSVNPIGAHNIPLATLGTLFLWFGWFGFNGGSTLKATASVGITILNTNIAAGAGGATALLFAWLLRRRFDASSVLLGILGGLVAITAGSNRVEPWAALVIGIVAAILVILGGIFIERILKIDDPVGAVTVHGIGGVVGTIALALLAPQNTLMVPYQSRLLQVGVQFLGVVVAFAWAFGVGLLFFWSINKLIRLRVRPEEERQGLNLAEYEDVASWLNLVQISRLQDLNVLLEERIKGRTQELTGAKRYTESIIRSMRESLVVTDTQGNIRDVNPTLEALLGYKREELVGKPLSILVPEEDVFFRRQMLKSLLEGEGIVHDYRTDFLTKDKDTVPVLFTGAIMKDDSGRPLGMVGIARDMRETLNLIRDLQRINQELGTFSEKLQTVMRSVRVPIATLDVERKVLSVNPAFEELTGWRMDEISGKQYDILLSLAVSRTHVYAGEQEPVFIGKAVITDRGGKRVDVSYTEAPLKDFQGNIIGSVSTMEDITRELEVDRMKSEFISTVSHELRTPLTSIKGYVDLILGGDAGGINETQKEFLQIVAQSTNRLADLVNDLLDVERIESGRIQLRREPVDIGVIIYQVIRTFSKEIEKKGISLYTAVPKTLPMVLGDRERIEQVLANLVSNAIKYNIPSGCIKVAAGLEDNFVKVDVMDSGLGISEEDQRRLFQKFFRASSAKTLEEGGTGLGLSIVKSIVEALGGKVRVKSKLKEGSTFTILLPVEKPPQEYFTERIEEKRVVAPKRTVMVVDDEPAVVKFLELQLTKAGYNVITVQDARTAVKMARERHPDVITLDILMPGVDGFKVLEELKSDKSTESIPVVILSIVEDPAKGFTLGAADYFKKPIEVPKLLNSIHNLMREVSGERGKKVLVVEDDVTVRGLLRDVLGTRGIRPLEAGTGPEGLELARATIPDLIILDLQLPGISGYEVIKQLKADSKTAGIPIIVLTASELGRGMPKVIALGADEYMRKPFDNRVLLSIVDKLTGKVTP